MLTLDLRGGQASAFRLAEAGVWRDHYAGVVLRPCMVAPLVEEGPVLVLVHGYRVKEALEAYDRVNTEMGPAYSAVVGVRWPGSTLGLGFFAARARAKKAGRLLTDAWQGAFGMGLGVQVDVQAHSLGCLVALEAVKAGMRVRNLLLSAAAVPDDVLAGGYGLAVENRAERCVVAHSKRDAVLGTAYRLAEWHEALGSNGPRNAWPKNVETLDCSDEVWSHGGYKRSPKYLGRWKELAA